MAEITEILREWSAGDPGALERLTPIVYRELRQLAAGYLRKESPGHVLQPTALIHEVYLRLVEQHSPQWKGRSHFFGVAARLMRQILVDHARVEAAEKRGGKVRKVTLHAAESISPERDLDLIRLADAMMSLEALDDRKHRIVELHFFGGLTVAEIAQVMGISESTAERDLRMAKAWLATELTVTG